MSQFEKHDPGTFCWNELGTTDAVAAKKFYGSLFGWESTDMPSGPGMVYTLLKLRGRDVGALYALAPEQRAAGVPPHWLAYIATLSADATAKRCEELGGRVVMDAFDVMDVGRMAVLEDPTGAPFACWQARSHIGAGLLEEPGTFCWNECASRDAARASTFYTALFGWTAEPMAIPGSNYTKFRRGDRNVGGLLQMTSEWQGAPSHWMPYVAVADCDAAAAKTVALGGKTCIGPTDIPTVGRFAVLSDPQSALFSVIALT